MTRFTSHAPGRRSRRPGGLAAALCAVAAIVLGLSGAPATASAAELSFCPTGSGAGQCGRPEGLAVDNATGRLYVTDRDNLRIDAFDSEGHFLYAVGWKVNKSAPAEELQKCTEATGCQAGSVPPPGGQFARLEHQAVAVDNNPASAAFHDFYVFDRGNGRISKFDPEGNLLGSFSHPGEGHCQFSGNRYDPIAIGPGGTIYLGDMTSESGQEFGRVEKFNPSTFACEGEAELGHGPWTWIVSGLAVDGSGSLLAVDRSGPGVHRYGWSEPTATPAGTIGESIVTALALDAAGHLWAGEGESAAHGFGGYTVLTEYEAATGQLLARFGYNQLKGSEGSSAGISPYPSSGSGAFVSGAGMGVAYVEAPPSAPGPIVPTASLKATKVGNVEATLEAEVNPEGKEASAHFEYLTQAAYEEQGDSFEGPGTVVGPNTPLGSDFHLHYASLTVGCPDPLAEAESPMHPGETAIEAGECLVPETEYRFRVVATNADNPTGSGEARAEGTFTTKAPLEIVEGFATEAGTESARLSAVVDPLGVPTSGHFQMVSEAQFEASGFEGATRVPPVGELSFGTASGPVTRSTVLAGLRPGEAYRYRILASDPLLAEPVLGEEAYRLRPFALPAAFACPANEAFRVGLSAQLPDCRAYEMVSPVEKANGDVQALAESNGRPGVLEQASVPSGGEPQRLLYGSYRAFGGAVSEPWTSQYLASRGAEGWQSRPLDPPRGRANSIVLIDDTEARALSPDLCSAWWLAYASPIQAPAAIPGQPNLYHRTGLCGAGAGSWDALNTLAPPHANYGIELQGASEASGAAVYAIRDSLPTEAPGPPACASEGPPGCNLQLYYQGPGEGPPRYVCVLPGGEAIPSGGCSAGTASVALGQSRDNTLAHALAAEGSQVYWTASLPSSPDGTGPGKLYLRLNPGEPQSPVAGGQCSEPALACTLAVSAQAEAEAGSLGSHFWDATADGSRALFSTGNRLYEYDRESGEDHLLAAGFLGYAGAGGDLSRFYFAASAVLAPARPHGEAPAAGADNLYLYDASRPEGQRFAFVAQVPAADLNSRFNPVAASPSFKVSRVNPDGQAFAFVTRGSPVTAAYPAGYDNHDARDGKAAAEVYLYDARGEGGEGSLLCASCNPTGARPVSRNLEKGVTDYWAAAHIAGSQNSFYASRNLAPDGRRLYFEAFDSLSPQDTNGVEDVYEWQAAGSGGCTEGSYDYSPSNGGCIDLISTGKDSGPSRFVDANPSGHDVFIATNQSIVPQDTGLIDIYDAREGGGFPPPAGRAAACEGEACQGPFNPPSDPTPASSAFQGPGNAAKEPAAKKKRHANKKKSKRNAKHKKKRKAKQRAGARAKEQK